MTADASDGEGFTWPPFPKVSDTLRDIGSIAPLPEQSPEETPFDITRESLRFPVPRSAWLQSMARGETAAMVCLAYSNLRGYGYADHGTIGEVRVGSLPVKILHPVTGVAVTIGSFEATECEMFGPEGDAPVTGAKGRLLPAFGLSYGLVIGRNERKAIAMSILDSALQAGELASIDGGEVAPSNDQEMVLSHIDGIESTGFVEHLKLPHYVTFGSQIRTQMSPRRDVMLARSGRLPASRQRSRRKGAWGMNEAVVSEMPHDASRTQSGTHSGYSYAFLDELTKKSVRRAILKAVAVPGYQVPFGSTELPIARGWGTGGLQVTLSLIGPGDVLKVIDQGSDDSVNAVNIRQLVELTAPGVDTTARRKRRRSSRRATGSRRHHCTPTRSWSSRFHYQNRCGSWNDGSPRRDACMPRPTTGESGLPCMRTWCSTGVSHGVPDTRWL